jgi:uncharacterized protein (DUF427 family)
MALTVGSGPFGTKSRGAFNFDPETLKAHTLYFEDSPKRVRAVFNGAVVADSDRVKMLHETGHLPVYYFPEEDVEQEYLEKTDHTTHCPYKGAATYWSVQAAGETIEDGAWSYPEPLPEAAKVAGYLCFLGEGVETKVDGEPV